MQEHELQKIISAIQSVTAESIEKTVNGKIRRLDEKLESYIKHDMEWKTTVQPVIDAYTTTEKVGKFLQWLSKIILAVGVIVGAILYKIK